MSCNAEAPAEVRPLPRASERGADRRDSSSTAERLRLLLPDEMTDTGAEKEVEVEALADGTIEDEIELLVRKAVAEAEGEGEGSAGGEVAGADESGGNSVQLSDSIWFELSLAA